MSTMQNLQQWLYQVLNGTVTTYEIIIIRLWWLILALIGSIVYFQTPQNTVTAFLMIIWLLGCFLAARPSKEDKDIPYFIRYVMHALLAICIAFVLGCLMLAAWLFLIHVAAKIFGFLGLVIAAILQLLFLSYPVQLSENLSNGYWWGLGYALIFALLCIPVLFTLLFLFEAPISRCNVRRSIKKGFKLAWHSYLPCLVLSIPFQILGIGCLNFAIRAGIPNLITSFCLLFPLYLNIFISIYITERHENSGV